MTKSAQSTSEAVRHGHPDAIAPVVEHVRRRPPVGLMKGMDLRRWIVIAPFLFVVGLFCLFCLASVDTLSAVRTFVHGESLWSKGQKDAVYFLGRYLQTQDEADYRRFTAALAVPRGDMQARMALDEAQPDLDRARQGFLAGGVHPDDIDGVIRLYLRFHDLPMMREAVAIWVEGERYIAELEALGLRMHEAVRTGRGAEAERELAARRLPAITEQLTVLERRFSDQLGDMSRTVRRVTVVATLVIAAILAAAGVLLTARILRRQARTEQALRRSNERWSMAAAGAGLGLFEWDIQRDRVALDSRGAVLCGLPSRPRIVAGGVLRRAIHRDDRHRVLAAMRQALVDRSELVLRFRLRRPDGSERHLEINGHGDQTMRARRPRMMGVLWDVTDYAQAEQLRFDKEAAERANRAKTEFLSRVSHELRTPLNAILGFAQLMQADGRYPLGDAQAGRLGHVIGGGQHLLGLINDVLDLSSIDQGSFALASREVDLGELLRESVQQAGPMADEQQVALRYTAPAEPVRLQADPLRLQQVFGNLLSNAIKYNRPGGTVDVGVAAHGEMRQVTVRDSGRGMDETQLGQLFQPFNRLGQEYSRIEGSGLGLVITRQLVQRMGGTIDVESRPGVGSTFRVTLPATVLA